MYVWLLICAVFAQVYLWVGIMTKMMKNPGSCLNCYAFIIDILYRRPHLTVCFDKIMQQ